MKKRIALVGLGKQNTKDHLTAVLKSDAVDLVAVCDQNEALANEWGEKLGVAAYTSVESLAKHVRLDAAIVAVPHFAYLHIVKTLAAHKIHILKEKPLAMSFEEAVEIADTVEQAGINLTIAVQRKHNKIYNSYLQYVSRIGNIFSVHGHYTLNIPRLDSDWRSSSELAGGGAVLDMGYHLIDLVVWYFGLPERISAELGFHNRVGQTYDVEDTAKIQFSYPTGERRILGSLLLSRIYPEKDEALSVYGTNGTIVIYKDRIELRNQEKELMESVYVKSNGDDVALQFDSFISSLDEDSNDGNYREHMLNMAFIDSIYRSDRGNVTVRPLTDRKYRDWLTEKHELATLESANER